MADETITPGPPPSAPAEPAPPAEVAPVLALLERGDHRQASALLARVLAGQPAPEVERAARELAARLAPDPAAIGIGAGTLALLLFLAIHYLF